MTDPPKAGFFSPEDAKLVLDTVRELISTGVLRNATQLVDSLNVKPRSEQGKIHRPQNVAPPTPLVFRNDSGEAIPPYACMQVVDTYEDGPRNILIVQKPSDEFAENGPYVFNRHREVLEGEFGTCDDGTEVHAISEVPTADSGTRFGPQKDEWKIQQLPCGPFIQAGPDDLGEEVVRVFVDAVKIKLEITLEDCLTRSDETGQGKRTDNDEILTFDNYWQLDGIKNSEAVVERYQTSDGEWKWRLDRVVSKKARWLILEKTESGWDVVSFHSGEHPQQPEDCGLEVVCPFDCSCLEPGDKVKADYDANTDRYYVTSSDSATLGPADTLTAIDAGTSSGGGDGPQGNGCSITYTAQPFKAFKCKLKPSNRSINLNPQDVTVYSWQLTNSAGGSEICITPITIKACGYSSGSPTCIPFEKPDCVEPEPPALCSGQAEWTWDGENWNETQPCPAGGCYSVEPEFDGVQVGETVARDCYQEEA